MQVGSPFPLFLLMACTFLSFCFFIFLLRLLGWYVPVASAERRQHLYGVVLCQLLIL